MSPSLGRNRSPHAPIAARPTASSTTSGTTGTSIARRPTSMKLAFIPGLACQETGQGEGLSQRSILDRARWYTEQADAQRQGTGDVDSTTLDTGLRQALAEQVLPEFIEIEFQRVMAEVFRV